MNDERERIDNIVLIENAIDHLEFELQRDSISYFRVAREAYQVLYRAMIEALRGTANFDILKPGKGNKHSNKIKYLFGNDLCYEIKPLAPMNGCKKAWRFSEPQRCEPPLEVMDNTKEQANHEQEIGELFEELNSCDLISFYAALAKIQTECFMRQYMGSKWIAIDDKEMWLLEWMHEDVRNVFEHFVPKLYVVCVPTAIHGALLCIRIANELLFDSGNVIFDSGEQREFIQKRLTDISIKLNQPEEAKTP